jgi:hypothetical protein
MSVNVDEDSQIPSYDSFNMLGNNKLPFIILLIVVIFIYIMLFGFLNNISVDNENTKWWILILEIILVIILIVVVGLNMDSLYEYNFSTEIKNLFSTKRTEVNVTVDGAETSTTTECATSTDASDGEVFNIPKNIYTYEKAKNVCSALNARLATYNEVEEAYNQGGNWCSYGWSDEQMALFPTQKDVYNKLKLIPGHQHDCGRPGVNGGYIDNKNFKFGVNCYGKKPHWTEKDKDFMDNYSYSPSMTDASYNDISNNSTNLISNLLIAPFNKLKWSYD